MKLFLLGLPGCGKSTMGKQLAEQLSTLFVDLDTEIEKREQAPVSVLFKEKGECYFRKQESTILKAWCQNDMNFVMATGGGAPCFPGHMECINKAGISIFLDVPIKTIIKRMTPNQWNSRPLLAGKDMPISRLDYLNEIRNRRIIFYEQAHLFFSGSLISIDTVLQGVKDWTGSSQRRT